MTVQPRPFVAGTEAGAVVERASAAEARVEGMARGAAVMHWRQSYSTETGGTPLL
jgi:hypothetical protein